MTVAVDKLDERLRVVTGGMQDQLNQLDNYLRETGGEYYLHASRQWPGRQGRRATEFHAGTA